MIFECGAGAFKNHSIRNLIKMTKKSLGPTFFICYQSSKKMGGVTGGIPPVEGVESNEVRTRGRLPPPECKKSKKFALFLNFFSEFLSEMAYQIYSIGGG